MVFLQQSSLMFNSLIGGYSNNCFDKIEIKRGRQRSKRPPPKINTSAGQKYKEMQFLLIYTTWWNYNKDFNQQKFLFDFDEEKNNI